MLGSSERNTNRKRNGVDTMRRSLLSIAVPLLLVVPGHLSADPLSVSLLPGRTPELGAWWQCGRRLGKEAGLSRSQTESLLLTVGSNSHVRTTDFLTHALAVMFVESRMRHDRTSDAGAAGVMQVMPIAAEHMRQVHSLGGGLGLAKLSLAKPSKSSTPAAGTTDLTTSSRSVKPGSTRSIPIPLLDAGDTLQLHSRVLQPPQFPPVSRRPSENVRVGTQYLSYCLDLADGSWVGALVCYNAGPQRLQSLRNWDTIPEEASEYVTRVLHARHICGGSQ